MKRVTRRGVGLFFSLAFLAAMVCSCVATRTIQTTQSHTKNGDTIAVMTTKTVETYTATKPASNLP